MKKSALRPVVLAALAMLLFLPWTAHAFDVGSFLNTVDRSFYCGVSPFAWWPFGTVALVAIFTSQLPFLILPTWTGCVSLRIFLFKLPFWGADTAAALLVARAAVARGRSPLYGVALICASPVVYATGFHGAFEAIPNLTIVVAVLGMLNGNPTAWAIALGVGMGAKYYPGFLIPLAFAISARRDGWRRASLAAVWAISLGLALIAPVHLLNPYSAASIVENTAGVEQSIPVSPWSLYYPSAPMIPPMLRLFLAALAALAPTLLAVSLYRHPATPDDAKVARFVALGVLLSVVLNPGAAPQFYSWIAGPVIIAAMITGAPALAACAALLGVAAAVLETQLEGFHTFLREIYPLAVDPDPAASSLVIRTSSAAIICGVVVLVGLLLAREPNALLPRRTLRGIGVAAIAVSVLSLAAAVATTIGAVRLPALRDIANRERLNTLVVTPAGVSKTSSRGCRVTFDLRRIGFTGVSKAMSFTDVTLRIKGAPPRETRVRQAAVAGGDWIRRRSDVIDLQLGGHASTAEFAVDAHSLIGASSLTFTTRPCVLQQDPVLAVHLDVLRAERAYFGKRR